jgi:hypothetical protein
MINEKKVEVEILWHCPLINSLCVKTKHLLKIYGNRSLDLISSHSISTQVSAIQ